MKIKTNEMLTVARSMFPGLVFELGDDLTTITLAAALKTENPNELLFWVEPISGGMFYIIDYTEAGDIFTALSDFWADKLEKYTLVGIVIRDRKGSRTQHNICVLTQAEIMELEKYFWETYDAIAQEFKTTNSKKENK